MRTSRKRKAFSMVELIFVIIVLGIVSSIGAEIIAKIYRGYILQRAIHRAESKTELAALQIANRLQSAIPMTVYRIKNDDTLEPIERDLNVSGNLYKGIRWVAADIDSRDANSTPGWSGMVDLNLTGKDKVISPGSNISFADRVIQNLSTNPDGTKKTIENAVIYFPGDPDPHGIKASGTTGTTLMMDNNLSRAVEHYKLAWSAYAVVCEDGNNTYCGNLWLYYKQTPDSTTPLDGGSGDKKALLLRNVSTFKFRSDGQTIRFKICKEEKIGDARTVPACKEKAVF